MTTSEENTEWNELQWLNDDRFVATLAAICLGGLILVRVGAGPPISTEISGEDALVDLADVSVFRVDHLRAACFRDLAKQHVSFGGRNLPVILHPIDHLLEGNAHGVFQRTGAT